MYRFIGKPEDVSYCKEMDTECIAAGCVGYVNGQCHFDPLLNLLSSGNEYYAEILTECVIRDTVFRVEKDGLQSSGGLNPLFDTKGKIWMKASHLKNHFKQMTTYNCETHTPIYLYKEYPYDAEVVEYALVEVKRIPVCEFLGVKCDEDYPYI